MDCLEQNPQFRLSISEPDYPDLDEGGSGAEFGTGSKNESGTEATVIVSLLQQGRRQMRNQLKTEHTNIGVTFRIYQVRCFHEINSISKLTLAPGEPPLQVHNNNNRFLDA